MSGPAGLLPPVSSGLPSSRRWPALGVLCLALLVVTLDNTILNVVLPTLTRQMDATSSQLQWVVDAYVLVFAGLLLVAGSLADRLGRKRTFLTGLLVFLAGSAWAAFAGSVGMLIAARAFMGIGAALINPSTLSIVTTLFTDHRERQRAFGIWAATSGVGIALGPIAGGLLLAHFWWGSVFLINVPVIAVALVCAVPLVPDSRDPAAGRPDLVGSALSIAGLSLTLWAVIEAPNDGWTSDLVLLTGLGGLAVLAAFVVWELRTPHPMLKLRFFRDRGFSAGIGTLAFVMLSGSGALFILTQYLQFHLGYSALECGVRVLPAAAAIVVVAPAVAPLARVVGRKWLLVTGLSVVGAGLFQLSRITVDTSYLSELPYMTLLGVGMGLVLPAATASIMESLPRAHTGVGSATNSTFMQMGTALGVAVLGSLLSTRYRDQLAPVLSGHRVPEAVRETVLGSLGGAHAVAERIGAPARPLLALAESAFVDGLSLALRTGALVVLAAALLVWLVAPSAAARERERKGS
ncbi:MFS transporter [Streptomyces sp. ODS28]|uniref:MFS transporter n=1 Tax=Streptomyces sp. ODS28 TaxID=3136688 RepID=UPI0031EF23FC